MRAPAIFIAIPLLAGSLAGLTLVDAVRPELSLCAAAGAVLAWMAAAAWLEDGHAPEVTVALVMGCALAGFSLGLSAARAAYGSPLAIWFDTHEARGRGEPAVVDGVLLEDASPGTSGVSVTLDVRSVDGVDLVPGAWGRAAIRVAVGGTQAEARAHEWRAGRTVRAPITLRRPASYRNPGTQNEARALARRGIALVGSVKSASLVDVVARGGPVAETAAHARAWTRSRLARHVGRWDPRSSGLVAAILIGDRSGMAIEDERRLQMAGTYHVIAISGGNIAILAAALLAGLHVAGVPRRVAACACILVLWFYAHLAGAPASVTRAVTVAMLYLAGRAIDHRGPPLNALAVAAACATGFSPLSVADAGFILSFGATLGILLGVPRLLGEAPAGQAPVVLRRLVRPALALLAATVCAEIALVPASAAIFSRVTFAGILLNFVAIPLMSVTQLAGMVTLGLAHVSDRLAGASGYVAHVAASWLVDSAALVEFAPWLVRDVAPPAWWVCGGYYAACVGVLFWRRHVRAGALALAFAMSVILAAPPAATRGVVPAQAADVLRVTFIDVGQGDATLAVLPGGRTLLIDAGGLPGSTFGIGERVLVPALMALRVRHVDTLVLTHGDPDHIGGALAVLRRFRPRTVWEGVPVPPHEGLRAVAALADAQRAAWRTVQAGDIERSGGVDVRVLHPSPPDWERQRVRNEDSIVLELRYGEVSVLLPGDIGRDTERVLARTLSPGRTVVLRAPHHGSATSSSHELLTAARPDAVIVSAGRSNRFGHPTPAVVGRYREAGAVMFRTDEDGAVTVETDGRSVSIVTVGGRRVLIRQ